MRRTKQSRCFCWERCLIPESPASQLLLLKQCVLSRVTVQLYLCSGFYNKCSFTENRKIKKIKGEENNAFAFTSEHNISCIINCAQIYQDNKVCNFRDFNTLIISYYNLPLFFLQFFHTHLCFFYCCKLLRYDVCFLLCFSSYLYSVGCFRSPLICYVLLPISSNWVISWRFSLKRVFVLQKVAGVISAPGFLLAVRPNCVFVLLSVSFDCWFSLECGRNVGETAFFCLNLICMMFMLRLVRLGWLYLFPFLCGRCYIAVIFLDCYFGLSDERCH